MVRKLQLLISFFFLFTALNAQLTEGDIMFVGYNADFRDGFAIVTLVDIPASSTIYFTDNEWNGSAIGSGGAFNSSSEGEMTWSTGGSIISMGTVVTFNETNNSGNASYGATVGTITGTINLNASNEVLYAFIGSNDITPTTFLSAIANDGFTASSGTLTNTGLTAGTNATSISGDEDVMVYTGSLSCNSTIADCAAEIADPSNWDTEDGSGNQDGNGIAPDFPDNVPSNFGGTALPIELVFFKAEVSLLGSVQFLWQTASETNNDYFTIERSIDGMKWISVDRIPGAGNSFEIINYSFEDIKPFGGRSYYRLKQTDYDGAFSFSNTISVQVNFLPKINRSVKLYPNPFVNLLYLEGSEEDLSNIKIFNLFGLELRGQIAELNVSDTKKVFDFSNLNKGVYLVKSNDVVFKVYKK